MKQIYCKEGTLCCQYPLEPRKIIKKSIFPNQQTGIGFVISLGVLGVLFFILFAQRVELSEFIPLAIAVFLLLPIYLLLVWITIIYQWLYFRYYFYDITDKEIIIRKGVVSRNEVIVPFSKIQDVYVDQDFFDRLFGLYDVHLSTAAIGSYLMAHIDGVNVSNSQALKEMLIEKTRTAKKEESGV